MQNEQVQALTGISAGSGSHVREKYMFPQWHLPWINTRAVSVACGTIHDLVAATLNSRRNMPAPKDQIEAVYLSKRNIWKMSGTNSTKYVAGRQCRMWVLVV
jgi:hypothetical protein